MVPSSPDDVRPITVRELLETNREEWDLSVVTGESGLDRKISSSELNRPGLALAGYYDVFSSERVQLIGLTETSFLQNLSARERTLRLRAMFKFDIPCLILTRSLEALPELAKVMQEEGIPLLQTSHLTTPFQAELGQYLERRLAPRRVVHGVMVEVFGLGVMIQGKSGVGKSECALELVDRGHLLIADDIIMVRKVSRGRLFAEPAPNLRYHMEIRGVGIIDAERLFGVRSVRDESEISLIVQLEKWDPDKEYERLGLTDNMVTLFDCQVPQVVLPVEPSRNISQIIEIAALMQRLKSQGVNVARDFDKRIQETIGRKSSRILAALTPAPVKAPRERSPRRPPQELRNKRKSVK